MTSLAHGLYQVEWGRFCWDVPHPSNPIQNKAVVFRERNSHCSYDSQALNQIALFRAGAERGGDADLWESSTPQHLGYGIGLF